MGGVVTPALTRIDRRPGQPSVNAVTSVSSVRPKLEDFDENQRREIGVSLRDCSEHLPSTACSFDITDADFQVPFTLFRDSG